MGSFAYRLDLPEKFAGIHNVFHVSHLRRCLHNSSLDIQPPALDGLDIEPDLTSERKPLRIIVRGTKQLRSKSAQNSQSAMEHQKARLHMGDGGEHSCFKSGTIRLKFLFI
jgi:hypothetical protein